MKRILVFGAGGSPAVNFIRSLKQAPEKYYLVGTDCDKYYLQRSETDEKHLVPRADEKDYLDVINGIIDETKVEFCHAQNDTEISYISKYRDKLNAKTFLPVHKTVEICQNKLESYKRWEKAGLQQPETMKIDNEDDLKAAFEKFKEVWVRDTSGAGGKGSLRSNNFKITKTWIDFKQGWGHYTAAECLTSNSITWQSIWEDGQLIVAQGRKRLYWELAKIAPSGISGATGAGITVSNPILDDIAQKAIFAIDNKPNGIFSVDMTYDNKGVPNPTEINIARFFTTHEFFTKTGLNMPHIYVKLAYGEEVPEIKKKLNPLKPGLVWIRGIDFLPVLTDIDTISKTVDKLNKRRKNES
jgi:carbamoyl-phosphate synthase large subunit